MTRPRPRLQIAKYLAADYLSALASWILLFYYRKNVMEGLPFGPGDFHSDPRLLQAVALVPLAWVFFYYLSGQYRDPYHKSRLLELGQTLFTTLIGCTLLFFVSILDDSVNSYADYYTSFLVLLGGHFTLTYLPRLAITTAMIRGQRSGRLAMNAIFIGGGRRALDFYNDHARRKAGCGVKIVGFVSIYEGIQYEAAEALPRLGSLAEVRQVILDNDIREVIIASDSSDRARVEEVIAKVEFLDVRVRLIPDLYNILTGRRIITSLYGSPLLEISHDLMPAWQMNTKRFIDIAGSAVAMAALSPVYLFLAVAVRATSPGPAIYSHERIGRRGKPFRIYKFRSMVADAEKAGPALSSDGDPRITRIGRFMRRCRLDEIPQFYNVLRGDMSLVGPRPERQFFIDQIVARAPLYTHLLQVRPGITSWGQVKYGYAENVDQMIQRLRFDLIYIENMSIYFDIKILIYTIRTVLEGSGK